jgi:hypothetical protein
VIDASPSLPIGDRSAGPKHVFHYPCAPALGESEFDSKTYVAHWFRLASLRGEPAACCARYVPLQIHSVTQFHRETHQSY